jgi:uncharacterized protein (DUF433 family)
MIATIENNRIAGTRITVWDVLHYLENGWETAEIAELLRLSREQVQAAERHIEQHREYVMAVHRQIEERNARGNPPAIEAKLAKTKAKMEEWRRQRQTEKEQQRNGSRGAGGC